MLVNTVRKPNQHISSKKRIDLIYRTALHKWNIFNSPNDTKCSKNGTKEPSPITPTARFPEKTIESKASHNGRSENKKQIGLWSPLRPQRRAAKQIKAAEKKEIAVVLSIYLWTFHKISSFFSSWAETVFGKDTLEFNGRTN